MLDPYNIKSPVCIVPGFDALVGRLLSKSKYFSFPFSSLMLIVKGSCVLNEVAVALLYTVALNMLLPTVILSFILSVFEVWLELLVTSLVLLQQAKSWMQIKQDKKVITAFIVPT